MLAGPAPIAALKRQGPPYSTPLLNDPLTNCLETPSFVSPPIPNIFIFAPATKPISALVSIANHPSPPLFSATANYSYDIILFILLVSVSYSKYIPEEAPNGGL